MSNQEITQITMQTIKLECQNCHKMLVESIMNLQKLEQRGLSASTHKINNVKSNPSEIHNYDAKSAYTQNSAYKAYMSKGDLTYKQIKF